MLSVDSRSFQVGFGAGFIVAVVLVYFAQKIYVLWLEIRAPGKRQVVVAPTSRTPFEVVVGCMRAILLLVLVLQRNVAGDRIGLSEERKGMVFFLIHNA